MSEQLSENIKPGHKPGFKLTRTNTGYQVCGGTRTYEVTVENEKLVCNCSDFEQKYKDDTTYYCKHIIAALADFEAEQSCVSAIETGTTEQVDGKLASSSKPNGAAKAPITFPVKQVPVTNKQSHMLIKRSLGGDGRIDSISIEVDFGLTDEDETVIKVQALKALKLQDSIIKEFLNNGQPKEPLPEPPEVLFPAEGVPEEALDAIMTRVGTAQSKWGHSLYITFELPEGKTAKLFGNQKYLSNQIAQAGFAFAAEKIIEGIVLNIPCKVTTVINGKFINVDKVFPV